jgi:DNA-binding transcriptional ArsR family regulator
MTRHANKNNEREQARRADPRIALLRQLADPIRLRVIDRLGNEGPATVTRLAGEMQVPLPQLSNHLRRLREAGLVTAQRTGRQVVYALGDPGLELLTPLLDSITGRVLAAAPAPATGLPSRTCYGHLGGEIGVDIYRSLCRADALRPRADGIVELGPSAAAALGALGVDPAALAPGRRRFAFECLDATERAPHLAGALGDAVAAAMAQRGWTERTDAGRTYRLTPAGWRGLTRALAAAG